MVEHPNGPKVGDIVENYGKIVEIIRHSYCGHNWTVKVESGDVLTVDNTEHHPGPIRFVVL